MNIVTRSRIASGVLLLVAVCVAAPLLAQGKAKDRPSTDGTWTKIRSEDSQSGARSRSRRILGPAGERRRPHARRHNEEWVTSSSILQCRPHPVGYQPLGPDPMRIEKLEDPINRQLIAYRVSYDETPGDRMIWLDHRPHPSEYAEHSWEGFSTGPSTATRW
jgi:hypothetical protein